MFNTNGKCIECVVCKAAGKSDNLGHWIRNDKGTVVCPTLLEQDCRHCGQKGHTPKYCFIKKQEERQDRRALFAAAAVKVDKKMKKNAGGNSFGALDESSDEEDKVDDVKPRAAVVDKMTKEELRQVLCGILGVNRQRNAVAASVTEAVSKPLVVVPVPIKRRLWSEMMDDSDDDEDE